jgi:hypothetical protein
MRVDESGFGVAAAERVVEAEGGCDSEDGIDDEVEGVVPVLGRGSSS